MMCAARHNNIDAMNVLFKLGTSLNATDYDGRSALHISAANHNYKAAKWLLERRADPNPRDDFGFTPLNEAYNPKHKDDALIALLMECGAETEGSAGLVLAMETENWAIRRDELVMKEKLTSWRGQGSRSIVRAVWRGTPVCARLIEDDRDLRDVCHSSTFQTYENQLLKEIQMLSDARHPDLIRFLGACVDSAPSYYVMEFADGGDMESLYQEQQKKLGHLYKPPLDDVIKWLSCICRALCFLHNMSEPMKHGDLKPVNLLFTASRELKVAEFGLSELSLERRKCHSAIKATYARGGSCYAAPEVVRMHKYTSSIDIYSLGLVLWFMLQGCHPYVDQFGVDPSALLQAFLDGYEPRPPVDAVSPASFRKFMQDAWHIDPAARPSSHDCALRIQNIQRSAWSKFRQNLKSSVSMLL